MCKVALFLIFLVGTLCGESVYPVDMSFLIADIKYSQEHGIKVCEMQHGVVSTFRGDVFSHDGEPVIAQNLFDTLALYVKEGWTVPQSFGDAILKKMFANQENWHAKNEKEEIFNDLKFLEAARKAPFNSERMNGYHGFVYLRSPSPKELDELHEAYPGVIFIDRAISPYWANKAKMSALFEQDPMLGLIKPKWNVYPKTYTPKLAERIKQELGTQLFVIKPKGSCSGKGVIIVSEGDLDAVLKYILKKSRSLKKNRDKSYNYWYHTKETEFIVEQFFASDPIRVPHLKNELYQPTMRVSFLFVYEGGEAKAHFLGAFWLLPKNSLEKGGSLNDTYKSCCGLPRYTAVDSELEEQVAAECHDPFLLFYQKMLENQVD